MEETSRRCESGLELGADGTGRDELLNVLEEGWPPEALLYQEAGTSSPGIAGRRGE